MGSGIDGLWGPFGGSLWHEFLCLRKNSGCDLCLLYLHGGPPWGHGRASRHRLATRLGTAPLRQQGPSLGPSTQPAAQQVGILGRTVDAF